MAPYTSLLLALLPALLPTTYAQTWTACNPLNTTGCPDMPALGSNATFLWNQSMADSKVWNTTNGNIDWTSNGGEFTINGKGDSPTIKSNFYIFGGIVSIVMKAAKGQGIVSSIVMQSDDLDEVDWELIGGNDTHVQSNYFGKGNTTSYDRAVWHEIDDPQNKYHNYTVHWTKDAIDWYIDDNKVRTLNSSNALGGKNFPQTPMNIRLGIWAGGDPKTNDKYTVEWAGGETDYSKAPFTQTIQAIYVEDFSANASSYAWGDMTGSWDSIKVTEGKSAALKELTKVHGVENRWKALPKGAQIAIICSAIGVAAVGFLALMFCCIMKRRQGRREHALLEAEREKEAAELMEYKRKMAAGHFSQGSPMNRF